MAKVQETTTRNRRPPVSERRRLAIDAHIDLVLEGRLPPSIEEVSERSGVSVATLFRYFENLDQLRNDAARRAVERFHRLFVLPDIGVGTREERIRRIAAVRVELWETTHYLARLVRSTALKDPGSAEMVKFARQSMADQIRAHFAPELSDLKPAERDDAVATIASLTSVESWEQFRHASERTAAQTQRAWARAINRILAK